MKANYKKELVKSGYYADVISALTKLVTLDDLSDTSYPTDVFFDNGEWHDRVTGESLKTASYALIGIIEGVREMESDIDWAGLDQYSGSQFRFESQNYAINVMYGFDTPDEQKQAFKNMATWYVIWTLVLNVDWNAHFCEPEDFEEFSVNIVG